MEEVISAVEEALREKGEGTAEMPPKPGIHPAPDAFIHAMPALLKKAGATGLKWIAGYPENPSRGLPYISGLFILNDVRTGLPLAVMDATWITAVRTGAATAVAARFLARTDASSAGIVACGVQGRTNLEALACLFPLKRVHAYDIRPEAARRYADEMGRRLGLDIRVVSSAREAVEGMDVVVTGGPIRQDPRPFIAGGWLGPGSFACALDFDSSWTPEAMEEVEILATDDRSQLNYYRSVGYFRNTPDPQVDLADLVTGRHPGRRSHQERTMSLNLGLALEDLATARLLYRKALEQGVGVELEL